MIHLDSRLSFNFRNDKDSSLLTPHPYYLFHILNILMEKKYIWSVMVLFSFFLGNPNCPKALGVHWSWIAEAICMGFVAYSTLQADNHWKHENISRSISCKIRKLKMYLWKMPSGKKTFNTWKALKGGTRALHTFSLMARCVGELLPKYCLSLLVFHNWEPFSSCVRCPQAGERCPLCFIPCECPDGILGAGRLMFVSATRTMRKLN